MSAMTVSPVTTCPMPTRTRHLAVLPAQPGPGRATTVALKLTRRGRLAATLVTAALLVGVATVGAQNALAGDGATTPTTATVVVQPGDTLWSVATATVPGADPRDVIIDIQQLNGLSGSQVSAGQTLVVPAG